jgi:hypothetical protein
VLERVVHTTMRKLSVIKSTGEASGTRGSVQAEISGIGEPSQVKSSRNASHALMCSRLATWDQW